MDKNSDLEVVFGLHFSIILNIVTIVTEIHCTHMAYMYHGMYMYVYMYINTSSRVFGQEENIEEYVHVCVHVHIKYILESVWAGGKHRRALPHSAAGG